MKTSFNRTIVELKRGIIGRGLIGRWLLIEPLWN